MLRTKVHISLLLLMLALLAGVLCAEYIPQQLSSTSVALAGVLCMFGIGYLFIRKSYSTPLKSIGLPLGMLALFALGFWQHQRFYQQLKTQPIHQAQFYEQAHLWIVMPTHFPKANAFYVSTDAYIYKVDNPSIKAKISLNAAITDSIPIELGKSYLVYNQLERFTQPKYYWDFDFAKFQERKGITSRIRVTPEHLIKVFDNKAPLTFYRRWQRQLIERIDDFGFNPQETALLRSLLAGDRSAVDDELRDNFQRSGLVHILAISGLHVGLVLYLLQALLFPVRWLPQGRLLQLILVIDLIWIYAALTGFSASVVRAATMFSLLHIGVQLQRKTNSLNSLMLAAIVLLSINTQWLFSVGFQLSFAAVWAILVFYPKIVGLFNPGNYLLKKSWQIAVVSFTAQLGVLPISLYYFHQFPGIFLLSNVLLVPFLGMYLGLGFITIFAGLINDQLAAWFQLLLQKATQAIILLAESMATFDAVFIKDIPFGVVHSLLSLGVVLSAAFYLNRKTSFSLKVLIFNTVGLALSLHFSKVQQPKFGLLSVMSNQTVLLQNDFPEIIIYAEDSIASNSLNKLKVYHFNQQMTYHNLPRRFYIKDTSYLIVDQNYPAVDSISADVLILKDSPKIHFEAVIQRMKPK
ncbi:MAG: ComEC/Rec2 family competence protein, partial [Flavobacteriaceae bacterium]|nr:ComEC/Rec2 family competence protein [Flavobacteriaceae bacterium]